MVDLNKSYESMASDEKEDPHFNYDSDGEPPTDQVGDKLTIVKRQQVTKTIQKAGESNTGKPGKPYIVKVTLQGYFAPVNSADNSKSEETPKILEGEVYERVAADEINGKGEVFVDHSEAPI